MTHCSTVFFFDLFVVDLGATTHVSRKILYWQRLFNLILNERFNVVSALAMN
jgi:hypothetical protein